MLHKRDRDRQRERESGATKGTNAVLYAEPSIRDKL